MNLNSDTSSTHTINSKDLIIKTIISTSLDCLAVVVFVTIGMINHRESAQFTHALLVAFPFIVACLTAHLFVWVRSQLKPAFAFSLASEDVLILGTVLVGMIIRLVCLPRNTPLSFVIAGGFFLTLFLLSWRIVYWLYNKFFLHKK